MHDPEVRERVGRRRLLGMGWKGVKEAGCRTCCILWKSPGDLPEYIVSYCKRFRCKQAWTGPSVGSSCGHLQG